MRGRDPKTWLRGTTPPVVALLLHALAAWLVTSLPDPTRLPEANLPSRGPPLDELTFDLDPTELADPPSERTIESAPAPSAPPAARLAARASASRSRPSELASATAAAREESVAPPSSEPSNEPRGEQGEGPRPAWAPPSEPARPIDIGIGIGEKNPFVPRSEAEVERAVARRAAERSLRDAARERDRALGLGPEGPVLTALVDGTSRSVAPVRGRAVFVATSNAEGEVVSIELLDAEGGRPGWADAARIALATLKGKKLRTPSSTTRAVMKIEVTSAWKLPSGQDPGNDVTLFHVPIAKGEGKQSAKTTILDPVPKLRVLWYEPSPGVKIPIPTVQIDIFSSNVDPTNLGASPRRVIHSRLLDSTIM